MKSKDGRRSVYSSAKWVQLSRDGRTLTKGIGGPGERERVGLKFQSGNGRVYSYDKDGVIHRIGTAGEEVKVVKLK